MRSINRKVSLAIGAAIVSVGLFGAVAFAAFAPDASTTTNEARLRQRKLVAENDIKQGKLKDLLDGLRGKGVITQAQEDAILAALKDAAGTRVKVEAVIRDFLGESAKYLGMTDKDLRAKLPGTSLGSLANGTAGKSRDGLVADLVTAGNADIDKALANKKITDDQAKKLHDALPGRVATFVDRTWAKPRTTAVGTNVKSSSATFCRRARRTSGWPRRTS